MTNTIQPPFTPYELIHATAGRVLVTAYGGHVLEWQAADGLEHLYLSPAALYREGIAIRGGIPVIFPQFAGEGALPKHGFARTAVWYLVARASDCVELALDQTRATHSLWPFSYRATLKVALLDHSLRITLGVENLDAAAFSFTTALHSYLAVSDIEKASVLGLQQLRYRDSAAGGIESTQAEPELRFVGEVDRIYLRTPESLILKCGDQTLQVTQNGFRDTVVWNPGPARAQSLNDLAVDGWRRFACIEAAAVEQPIHLLPRERWEGSQQLIVP